VVKENAREVKSMINYWIWDPNTILLFGITSIIVYAMAHNKELEGKVKPLPFGLAIALSSAFAVGLYCFVTLALFFVGYGVVELWKKRMLKKENGMQ
jgi:hypothetical protein